MYSSNVPDPGLAPIETPLAMFRSYVPVKTKISIFIPWNLGAIINNDDNDNTIIKLPV